MQLPKSKGPGGGVADVAEVELGAAAKRTPSATVAVGVDVTVTVTALGQTDVGVTSAEGGGGATAETSALEFGTVTPPLCPKGKVFAWDPLRTVLFVATSKNRSEEEIISPWPSSPSNKYTLGSLAGS